MPLSRQAIDPPREMQELNVEFPLTDDNSSSILKGVTTTITWILDDVPWYASPVPPLLPSLPFPSYAHSVDSFSVFLLSRSHYHLPQLLHPSFTSPFDAHSFSLPLRLFLIGFRLTRSRRRYALFRSGITGSNSVSLSSCNGVFRCRLWLRR